MKANIFEIKRFAVHDGDGIRTTVFFKGCPLKCIWCHNPEGISFSPQLAFYENKCSLCGKCQIICEKDAHIIGNKKHSFVKEKCVSCGKCIEECFASALTLYGREMTVEDLLPLLLEDKDFYDSSNGGVTLSGGECLMQADFCQKLLKKLKENGIHTAVDTCGFVPKSAFDKVIPYTDIFLYDIKAIDEDIHIKCTGQSNKLILENLKYVDDLDKKIEIRVIGHSDFNGDQILKMAALFKTLKTLTKVRVLPYHNYAGSKYDALGMKNTLPDMPEEGINTDEAVEILKSNGILAE